MRTNIVIILLALVLNSAHGIFLQPDLEKVPVERLVKNLENQLAGDPQNGGLHYALARVHSMAYALKEGELEVDKQTGQLFTGVGPAKDYPPKLAPVSGTPEIDQRAQEHLNRAIAHYRKAVELKKDLLPAQLGLAWCLDRKGEREAALAEYRKALDLAWQKEKAEPHIFVSSMAEEIAGYMLPLLDPKRDAEETKKVKEYQALIQKKPRAITPILIPVGSEMALDKLVNPDAAVMFDLDGSALARRWGWLTTNAAWLVLDHNRDGLITSGLQLLGSVTFWVFWPNGYHALAALDDNGDGELNGNELNSLALWHDRNSDGISQAGEVRSLDKWGITALGCAYETHATGIAYSPRGVRFVDGIVRPSYDWVAKRACDFE